MKNKNKIINLLSDVIDLLMEEDKEEKIEQREFLIILVMICLVNGF